VTQYSILLAQVLSDPPEYKTAYPVLREYQYHRGNFCAGATTNNIITVLPPAVYHLTSRCRWAISLSFSKDKNKEERRGGAFRSTATLTVREREAEAGGIVTAASFLLPFIRGLS
jgi:hypothetical protein